MLILKERARQIKEEGYTEPHDDGHLRGEILYAALAYLHATTSLRIGNSTAESSRLAMEYWPWGASELKVKSENENLVRAGALIAAELDRRLRMEANMKPSL
jgi:hypothetical protein